MLKLDYLAYYKADGELKNKKYRAHIYNPFSRTNVGFNKTCTRNIEDEEYKNNCLYFQRNSKEQRFQIIYPKKKLSAKYNL